LGKPRLSHKTTNSKRSSRFQRPFSAGFPLLVQSLDVNPPCPPWSQQKTSWRRQAIRSFTRTQRIHTTPGGHDSHVQRMLVHADRRTSCSTLLPFPPPIVEFRVQRQTRGPASTFPSWSLRGKPLKILRVPSQGIHRDPPHGPTHNKQPASSPLARTGLTSPARCPSIIPTRSAALRQAPCFSIPFSNPTSNNSE
jgi:hypothetical protein